MTTPAPSLQDKDRATLALGMTLCAMFLGLAINVLHGMYASWALFWLTIGAIVCPAAVVLRPGAGMEWILRRRFTAILSVIAFLSACILLWQIDNDIEIGFLVALLAALGLLQATNLRVRRIPLLVAMLSAFCLASVFFFTSPRLGEYPNIDVFLFQQGAANALQHGHDPYAVRFPNIYSAKNSSVFQDPPRFGPGTPFYGPGVVDDDGWLTYGFPYPPLSLLMVMPAYLLAGDCRYAQMIAVGLSALMMATARPGRWGALAALLFLVNPQGLFVIGMSWTEPLLLFAFSLAMFCACRWRKGLPWALGLFFATKQYTVLALPVLLLLLEGPNLFKELLDMVAKAGLVVAAITLPFFVWNPHDFIRSVVQLQFVQPFRTDALSYLVWIYHHNGGQSVPMWTPFVIVIPAAIIGIWGCPRSPAGFAAAVTLICVIFFAFNKQAFCNYYYFVIGTACWSVAAMRGQPDLRVAAGSAAIAAPSPVPLPSGL